MFTTPSLFVPGLLFPLFFFTAFAGGLSRVSSIPGFDFPPGYTAFQFVFVLLQSAAFGGVFTGFGVARDFEYGFARRLMLAAPNRRGLIAGYAIAAIVRWSVTATILTVVALVAGMNIGGGGVDLFALYLARACSSTSPRRSGQPESRSGFERCRPGPVMQMPVFLILFFAPVYVPLALLEGWLHAVASVNPTTAFLEAGRSLIAGEPTHVALAFGAALALGAAFMLWAFRGLKSAERAL